MHYVLAIDYGTSNTTAAKRAGDRDPVPVRLTDRGDAMPSSVLFAEDQWLVGQAADDQARQRPAGYERTPKRRLGEEQVLLSGQLIPVSGLVSVVLYEVLRVAAQQHDGQGPSRLLLTHPQSWAEMRIGRLREAAVRTGYGGEIQMVPEPIAAAYHYAHDARWSPGDLIGVVDFGGGTFDAALIRVDQVGLDGPSLSVVSSTGVDPLGGDDFDVRLEDWALSRLTTIGLDHLRARLESADGLRWRLMLREAVQQAKHGLSERASAPIWIQVGEESAELTITQTEFEDLIRDDVARAVDATRSLLTAGQAPLPLTRLYLTGGSCLVPLVQREMQTLTGGRVARMDDPKQVTALGALRVPQGLRPDEAVTRHYQPAPGPTPVPPIPQKASTAPPTIALLVGALVAAILLVVGALAVLLSSDDPIAEDPKDNARGTTSTEARTTTPPTTVTPPTDDECGSMTAADCSLATQLVDSGLAQEGTCTSSIETDFDVACTPTGSISDGTLAAASGTDVIGGVEVGDGADPTQLGTWDQWSAGATYGFSTRWSDSSKVDRGDIVGYPFIDGGARLMWTQDDAAVTLAVRTPTGDLQPVVTWWEQTWVPLS